MKILLDTCALSEIRHPRGHPAVKKAYQKLPESDLYISVVTLGEIVKGISLLDDGHRKNELVVLAFSPEKTGEPSLLWHPHAEFVCVLLSNDEG